MKCCEIIADNLSKAGWSWGCVAAVDSDGRTIWIVDAHRGGGKFESQWIAIIRNLDEILSAKYAHPPSYAVDGHRSVRQVGDFDIDDGRSFTDAHSHLHDYPFPSATANYLYPLTTGESQSDYNRSNSAKCGQRIQR
jgi:hypothetical protein